MDRHYKQRHNTEEQKKRFAYYCDYRKCSRKEDPFYRRDHYRDHLREYHKEDIEKRGVIIDEHWLEGRNVNVSWWRCPKCLIKVYVDPSGYDCPDCKVSCQSKRKDARRG